MFRYTKPLFSAISRASVCQTQRGLLASMSMRNAAGAAGGAAASPAQSGGDDSAGRIKGAPPISIEDLYGLLYMAEPRITADVREPKDMFENDVKLNQNFCYINGGYGAPRDDRSRNALWDMLKIKTLINYRDAGNKPELRKVLKEQSGTDELPQLYIEGKCVAKGKDFENIDTIKKALEPTIRAWPRDGPYQLGFEGYIGITQSDQFHKGTWKPKSSYPAPRQPGKRQE